MNQQSVFDWVPFYEELATKLLTYRSRQKELIDFLEELRAQGFTITPLEDMDESGRRFLLTEIDPFTFFGSFNRGIVSDMRIRILGAIKSRFGVGANVPTSFSGIPTLNNQKSWFFSYQAKRRPGDIDRLWAVFDGALRNQPLTDPAFATAFDGALEVRNTNFNLTMGLFWIRPTRFISLDGKMRDYLGIELPKQGLSFEFYRNTLEQALREAKEDLPHLSHSAHVARVEGHNQSPIFDGAEAATKNVDYWMVGGYWEDDDPQDQTKRFLAEGIWENGWKDRFLEEVKRIKVGDRIAIKASFTQKNDLPFDNRGKTVSGLAIKATGTVVKNHGDGRSVEVSWDAQGQPRYWYFYTNRLTIWQLRKDDEFAQKLIRFVFYGEPQDYEFFVRRWWDDTTVPESLGEVAESLTPYGIADMVDEGVFLAAHEVEFALRRLKAKRNLILQGAPGVGKTFIAKRLAYALMGAVDDQRVAAVQFHPSYSYEDFIRGYRPTSQAGQFVLAEGPFLRHCHSADRDPDRPYVLLIDEINRANLSQVFGELFMLLEADKRGKGHGVLPLYPRSESERIFVPENLYLIGTMNIADRSLALVDFALRRRFAFFDLEPRFDAQVFRDWLKQRGMVDSLCQRIITRMCALNNRIEKDSRLGPAFRVGHSFFCPMGKDLSGLDENWYSEIIKTEILPLLREYWFDASEEVDAAKSELLA
jgi:5-methylcytosine-specific restriction enzyme B